ncbi:GntR family transcriptional regulator [Limnohabitans sp.]|jgi:DNA-binding GntR family transcriptional regulator|uniref:GntR family transcriptional regulator n=1 Tax=Limnohabitans sp. TaxID=1907725 RepID=UPI002626A1CF|nr:GntR family transcriptional regulator [Limnohabitans sp.]
MPPSPIAQPKVSPLIPTLAMRIVEMIRRENYIIGHRLTELALSEELNVSRSPVRKALQYLEGQGVVTSLPRKGFQLSKSASELASVDLSAPETSDEDLYLRIANERIHGDLPEDVHESDLMEQFGTTRLQIQRVLHRMARESMIDRKPGRGWVFRPLLTNSDSHRESYRFRMIIEPSAILEPGYQPDLAELEKCRREQEELLQGGIEKCSPAELFRAGVHLHETVVAGAKNRFLLDSLRTINQMRRVVEYGTRLDRSRLHQQCREHLALIDLLVKGERMEAAHFLRQHLNGARISKIGES